MDRISVVWRKKILVRSWERDGGKSPVRFLELSMEKMVALGQKGVYTRVKVQVLRVGVLCLGVHGTWRAGGAGAGVGAAGFRRKELVGFLERLTWKEMILQTVPKDQPEAGEYAPF